MEVLNDAGKVVVNFDVGFGSTLYIRGQGAGLRLVPKGMRRLRT
jgi:hypothetical protein